MAEPTLVYRRGGVGTGGTSSSTESFFDAALSALNRNPRPYSSCQPARTALARLPTERNSWTLRWGPILPAPARKVLAWEVLNNSVLAFRFLDENRRCSEQTARRCSHDERYGKRSGSWPIPPYQSLCDCDYRAHQGIPGSGLGRLRRYLARWRAIDLESSLSEETPGVPGK